MKYIVEECNISRGGLYRHFSSVAEILADMQKQENCKYEVENDIWNVFFDNLKMKLINTDVELLRASIEFELTNGY